MSKSVSTIKELVATHYVLLLKTQHAHWNVRGSNFIVLHKFFEEIYDYSFEAIDKLAERLSMKHDEILDFSFQEIEKLSKLHLKNLKESSEKSLLTTVKTDIEILMSTINTAIENESDPITSDIFIGLVESLEMFLWKTKSVLS